MGYDGFGGGVVAEGGAGGLDVGGEFGLVEGFFGGRVVLFGDDVVDGLFHYYVYLGNATSQQSIIPNITALISQI